MANPPPSGNLDPDADNDSANNAFLDWMRQTVNLASGVLVLTVTFSESVIRIAALQDSGWRGLLAKYGLPISWIALFVVIFLGQAIQARAAGLLRSSPNRLLLSELDLRRQSLYVWWSYLIALGLLAAIGFAHVSKLTATGTESATPKPSTPCASPTSGPTATRP